MRRFQKMNLKLDEWRRMIHILYHSYHDGRHLDGDYLDMYGSGTHAVPEGDRQKVIEETLRMLQSDEVPREEKPRLLFIKQVELALGGMNRREIYAAFGGHGFDLPAVA
jgi:hypothetical protein